VGDPTKLDGGGGICAKTVESKPHGKCGGGRASHYRCPKGYECVGPSVAMDGFGTCEKP
jgi:hypothetical protein